MVSRHWYIGLAAAVICLGSARGEAGTWDVSIPDGYADVSTIQAGVWDAHHGRSLLANTNTTTVTFGVAMPSACPLVNINSSLTESCGASCTISYSNLTITQRNTLVVNFQSSLAIIGGSSTRDLQATPVPDLTLMTEAVSSPFTWLTEEYTGYTYTPKAAKYAACTPTNSCKFDFYAIDPATVTGSKGKACRFSMRVNINPIAVPTVSSSQLYLGYSGASLSASKAPLALLALLAAPALFFLAL